MATLIEIGDGERAVGPALWRGFRCRCPACGLGSIFHAFLKVDDACPSCHATLAHQRADDAPPYFVMVIVGHVVVGLMLPVEIVFRPPLWLHAALWIPLTLGLALTLLPRVKGAIVGLQWALRMHGFGRPAGYGVDTPTPIEEPRPT